MIKLVYCLRRLPHLTREQFQHHWKTVHAPLVKRHAKTLCIRRYVQMHTRDAALNDGFRAGRGSPEAWDGVAELWWDGAAELLAAFSSPEGQKAAQECLDDEKLFIDHARSPLTIGDENTVIAAG